MPAKDAFSLNMKHIMSLFPDLDRELVRERIKNIKWPVSGRAKVCEITVNAACNNRCLFCYNEESDFLSREEASFESISKTLYEGRKKGAWLAAVIGGEPTLREDIDKIARLAAKMGYSCVKVCTNGLRLADKKYAAHLIESGFNMFDISMHSADAETHDRLVDREGAFSAIMKAAENVKSLGGELGTNQVVNALNYRSFPRFIKFAYFDLGINYFNIIYSHYRGMMDRNKDFLKVSFSDAVPAIKEGLDLISAGGFPFLSRMLVNFPPCFFPEYSAIIADWEKESGGERLMTPSGVSVDMAEMKNAMAARTSACSECVLAEKCRGVDAEYIDLFGENEFTPLKDEPKNRLRTTFA